MKKKVILITVLAVLLAGAAFFVALALRGFFHTAKTENFAPDLTPTETPVAEEVPATQNTEPTEYVSPVDFEQLQKINPDIYAWIAVLGTDISYPLVQNEDDAFYLTHNSDRQYDVSGALFTQSKYNSTDFEDPLTVIYGHNMVSGKMMGKMQELYSDPVFLAEHNEIVIYMPSCELHYEICAATPYSNRHLLYNYDFSKTYIFDQFFNGLFVSRKLGATFVDDLLPRHGDKVVVLSTCMDVNNTQRFLVFGVLQDKIS